MRSFLKISICILLLGCSDDKNSGRVIDVEYVDESYTYSWTFENLKLVPLETTENVLISKAIKIEKKDNKFVLLNGNRSNEIFVFDGFGRFSHKIGRSGRGPGEITYAGDLQVDSIVRLYDRGATKLLNYDIEGEFLNEINIGLYITDFHYLSPAAFMAYEGDESQVNANVTSKFNIYDLQNDKHDLPVWSCLAKKPERSKYYFMGGNNFIYMNKDKKIFLNQMVNDTIYAIDPINYSCRPYIVFDFGKYGLSNKMYEKEYIDVMEFGKYVTEQKCSVVRNYLELGKSILISGPVLDNHISVFDADTDKKVKAYSSISFDSIHPFFQIDCDKLNLIGNDENNLFFLVEAMDLIKAYENMVGKLERIHVDSIKEKISPLEKIIDDISVESNPVIIQAEVQKLEW